MIRATIIAMLMHLCGGLWAQDQDAAFTIPFQQPAGDTIDQSGSLYVADAMGNLFKYNARGEYVVEYSPEQPARITDLEAWQGLRIFLFYRDLQQYAFLNRFLIAQGSYDFNPSAVGFVEAAAPSADNNVWLFDQADFSLKKYNLQLKQVVLSTPFDLLLDPDDYRIGTIREYQNKVYISDYREGIFVFDNLGNYLSKIPGRGVEYFSFWDQTLHFVRDNLLTSIALYNDSHSPTSLPAARQWQFAVRYENRLYLVSDSEIRVYH